MCSIVLLINIYKRLSLNEINKIEETIKRKNEICFEILKYVFAA